MCNILELSGLFVRLGGLVKFLVPGGTEEIARLWFTWGDQYPGLHYDISVKVTHNGPPILQDPICL